MVSSVLLRVSLLSAAAASAWAAVVPKPSPRPNVQLEARDTTPVSASELSGFAPYTQFARAAYCDPSTVQGWGCGEACDAVNGFKVTLTGGDGNGVQYYYVGYWPDQNTVVVAHQGTDPTQLVSVLTDGNILVDPLDSSLFPGIPDDVQVHDGFRNEQALTAAPILDEVKKLMSAHNTQTITTVGHSLGGALAEIDAVFFKLNIPDAKIVSRTYGTPRVGNPQWADYFDSLDIDFKRIDNKKDIVPIVPGRGLGFAHPTGEVHILDAGKAVNCPGQDDATDADCQISTVPNIFDGNVLDHLGPYEGIYIGSIYCT